MANEPGAFTSDPVDYAAPPWYGEIGQFLTTKFFGMKINRYMQQYGISQNTLAKVAAKASRNGSAAAPKSSFNILYVRRVYAFRRCTRSHKSNSAIGGVEVH